MIEMAKLSEKVASLGRLCRPDFGDSLRFFVLSLVIVVATGCQQRHVTAVSEGSRAVEPQAYTLGPGDQVRVNVFGNEDLSGNFVVNSGGQISLPLIRGVKAQGLTLFELEQEITDKLKEVYIVDPRVNVALVKSRPFCVLGEVRSPGCFDYLYGMRVAMAIAFAGGYTYRARENEVLVTREGGNKVMGNHDTLIFPGDVIEVSERFF